MMKNSVLLQVTSVLPQFKNGRIYFSGVRLHKNSHTKASVNDFYNVRTSENELVMMPIEGQIWDIIEPEIFVEKKPSPCGKYTHTHHTLSQIKKFTHVLPQSCKSFVKFIEEDKGFKGLGKDKAEDLWTAFRFGIFDILKRKDRQQLMTVLTEKSTNALIAGFEKYGNLRYATWMTEREIPMAVQHRIFKFKLPQNCYESDKFGNEYKMLPTDIIQENPYVLSTFGLAFSEVDKIAAKHFNVEKSDPRRLIAAISGALRHQTKLGHTIATPGAIKNKLKTLLNNDIKMVELAFKAGHDNREYIITASGQYQHKPIYIQENVVAKRLLKLKNIPTLRDKEVNQACADTFTELLPNKLEPLQIKAVKTAIENSVSCITGGPGTGKTFVLNAVLSAYKKLGYTIKAIALSGRAASAMKESIRMKTSTITRFLNEDPIGNSYQKFLVVIDESSMLDLSSMYRIVIHTHPNVRFLLVGDPDQLPSIGAGNIFSDIVASGVIANTKLEINRRSEASTGIPDYAENIVKGNVPKNLSTGNIHFHDTDYDHVVAKCIELFAQSPENSRIIASTKLHVKTANEGCQRQLNNKGERLIYENKHGWLTWDATDNLRKNDQVIFTKNNYDVDVQNGTLGSLISVEQSSQYIGEVQLSDSGNVVNLTPTLLQSLQLGYALTLHKAQGSQFPRCIIALSSLGMVDRSWLYTALTRAELEVHIVGPKSKLEDAIEKVSNASKRQTNLLHLLQTN
jgi:exodeoxyribonuclease V alpha subunit